ncbi:hypothetical protein SNK03_008271 [Fusarium graminearum]|nr:unnamed protein product [Fusarium graminearum]CAG1971454.1 unnamed protein product [Fusarium graminearum]VTO85511.1 unnamed protein product [Fusarium graminearum]
MKPTEVGAKDTHAEHGDEKTDEKKNADEDLLQRARLLGFNLALLGDARTCLSLLGIACVCH